MNFENYLNLKKALRIAMPCLALSFFVSCSNEETTGASDEMTSSASNLTLTATVPVAKEHSSTRVGIKDDASASPNYIWLEGERLTLYWKNLHDDDADQVLVYQVEGVSADGKSCTMNPVDPSAKLDNGFYKIHSLSPHTEFNFVNGELSAIIDLGNQNQPSDAVDHNYLSDKLYQYATTVVQVYGGDIISGTTNLPFEFITSLLRVRVENNTGLPIDVKKVKFSYSTVNNPQFYSKGIFTANPLKGAHDYAHAEGATLNDLSVTTEQELADGASFDVYMSFFPTAGYEDNDTETFNMVVDYVVSETDAVMNRNISVLNSSFSTGHMYLKFDGGDLFSLTLTLVENDLPGSVIIVPPLPPYSHVEYDGHYYTYNQIRTSLTRLHVDNNNVYVPYEDLPNSCPDGWDSVTFNLLSKNGIFNGWSFRTALGDNFMGCFNPTSGQSHRTNAFMIYAEDHEGRGWSMYDNFSLTPLEMSYYYRPICRRSK
jgi:hypothetical protein